MRRTKFLVLLQGCCSLASFSHRLSMHDNTLVLAACCSVTVTTRMRRLGPQVISKHFVLPPWNLNKPQYCANELRMCVSWCRPSLTPTYF
eukprot:2140519-Amphidinium_carterae.1